MGKVPGIRGNTYGLEISLSNDVYVKVGDQILTRDRSEANLFLMAYKMGRDHKKTEIKTALGV
jgi:hypothetical protein